MYKNLCTDGLGIAVRQNEMIEMALTYGYRGIEIDMADMVGRAESMGHQFATQFINSANVEVGTFGLPINFSATDEDFAEQEKKIDLICDLAKQIGAKRCYVTIESDHEALPYHENFEKHRTRITSVAERLAENEIICGLKFSGQTPQADEMQFIHKPDELVTLMKTIDMENVGIILDTWAWQIGGAPLSEIKELPLAKVTEVRLADAPNGFEGQPIDTAQRTIPGTHPDSLSQDVLDFLVASDYQGPIALTAVIPKSPDYNFENPIQRLDKVYEKMIKGELIKVAEEVTESEPVTTAAE